MDFVNHLFGAKRWLLSILLIFLMAGCGERATPTPLPPLSPTVTAAAQPAPGATAETERNDQLVVWLPAFTGLATESSAGTILMNAFHQFEQRNPTINLDVQVKADAGAASLFNFLRSAQQVAPTILPDVVLIHTQQLWQIVDLGLVVGMDEEELLPDAEFFPITREAVVYRTQAIGIPYAVDVAHLAYDREQFEEPPRTWEELLENGQPLYFPAAETGTSSATLLHYVAAGGELLEDGGISDPEALEAYFTFLHQAREQEIIPPALLDIPGFNATWRAFAEDRTDLAIIQVAQFYPNAAGTQIAGYAPVPTRSGETVTVADTWAFAILTEDPQRRQLAMTFINELLAPEIQGPWSQFVARLPSRPASLAVWTVDSNYREFTQTLLDNAVVPPNGPAFADFTRRLHTAQAGILRGDLTVEAAVASMVVLE